MIKPFHTLFMVLLWLVFFVLLAGMFLSSADDPIIDLLFVIYVFIIIALARR